MPQPAPAVGLETPGVPGALLGVSADSWGWLESLPELELLPGVSATTGRVPGAAKQAVADCLPLANRAMASGCERTQSLGWRLLFVVQACVLSQPGRGGKSGAREINLLASRLLSGDWESLWAHRAQKAGRPRQQDSGVARAVARATTLAREGRLQEAMKALLRTPMARGNPHLLEALKGLHPAAADPAAPAEGAPAVSLPPELVLKLAGASPRGRAAGVDGSLYEHVAISAKLGDTEALCGVVDSIANGTLCAGARRLAACCRLMALLKPNGKHRPIGLENSSCLREFKLWLL